jgi:thiol-disulfide isomerase/thioredoxin
MNKLLKNQKVNTLFRSLRPWLGMIILFIILRYTGALSGIASMAQSALFHSGALDAGAVETMAEKEFDYAFKLKDITGKTISVSDFKNKTIFLNIWATWCGPCKMEMPSIQKLYNSLDHDKVIFIMLSIDTPDKDQKVIKFIQDNNYTFPVFRPEGALPSQLQVPSIPTTFVISPAGKVVSKRAGAANYDTPEFKKLLEELSL